MSTERMKNGFRWRGLIRNVQPFPFSCFPSNKFRHFKLTLPYSLPFSEHLEKCIDSYVISHTVYLEDNLQMVLWTAKERTLTGMEDKYIHNTHAVLQIHICVYTVMCLSVYEFFVIFDSNQCSWENMFWLF